MWGVRGDIPGAPGSANKHLAGSARKAPRSPVARKPALGVSHAVLRVNAESKSALLGHFCRGHTRNTQERQRALGVAKDASRITWSQKVGCSAEFHKQINCATLLQDRSAGSKFQRQRKPSAPLTTGPLWGHVGLQNFGPHQRTKQTPMPRGPSAPITAGPLWWHVGKK